MPMSDGEFLDVERYLDVKRGEIYLGKAVLLVEGIAEEYLVPKFAELLGKPLDEKGIIICNINCTNFTPYVKLLKNLSIPYAIITDGDYYYENEDEERIYHHMNDGSSNGVEGWLGMEIIEQMVEELKLNGDAKLSDEVSKKDELFWSLGLFVGYYTFEVDMMEHAANSKQNGEKALNVISNLFSELTTGGKRQKSNFIDELKSGEYWKCLKKIEGNGIGKGRFSQRFSCVCMKEHIPSYIQSAINYIYKKVDG